MTSFTLSSLCNKFLFSSLENPGMFPPHCMPECLILSTVNRRQIFLSGLLNISFQNSLYNQCHITTYCPLNCLQLWKELLGCAPNCQPPLLLVSTIKHGRLFHLLLHWPTACFPNPAARSSDPLRLRFLQQGELIPAGTHSITQLISLREPCRCSVRAEMGISFQERQLLRSNDHLLQDSSFSGRLNLLPCL